jgi:spermidine/putrescine transport system substrate-binding protein
LRTKISLLLIFALFIAASTTLAQNDLGFWACPHGFEGQALHVYNWTTYIAEDTISNFEELCGVNLIYDTFGGDDEMLEFLRGGNTVYDLVVPSDTTVYALIAENLIQPLNFNNIPNFANVSADLKNPLYDSENVYTIPYQWGTVGIGYNRSIVGKDITSWLDMFTYSGNVAWLDHDRAMLGVALLILGYDPNTNNAAQVVEARQYLAANSANVRDIAEDDGQDQLRAGTVDIVVEYNGDIFQVMSECECDDYAYAIPQEGALLWVDNLAIPVGAPNKALAEVFIDYILDQQVGADISNYTAYASPNQASIDAGLINEEYLNNSAIYPDAEAMQNLFSAVSNEELATLYGGDWEIIKSSVGTPR